METSAVLCVWPAVNVIDVLATSAAFTSSVLFTWKRNVAVSAPWRMFGIVLSIVRLAIVLTLIGMSALALADAPSIPVRVASSWRLPLGSIVPFVA